MGGPTNRLTNTDVIMAVKETSAAGIFNGASIMCTIAMFINIRQELIKKFFQIIFMCIHPTFYFYGTSVLISWLYNDVHYVVA